MNLEVILTSGAVATFFSVIVNSLFKRWEIKENTKKTRYDLYFSKLDKLREVLFFDKSYFEVKGGDHREFVKSYYDYKNEIDNVFLKSKVYISNELVEKIEKESFEADRLGQKMFNQPYDVIMRDLAPRNQLYSYRTTLLECITEELCKIKY